MAVYKDSPVSNSHHLSEQHYYVSLIPTINSIYLGAQVLKTGVVLADLPGTSLS